MHPHTVLRRRRDAIDDEYDMLHAWMPRAGKTHGYDSYLDFMHGPRPVATSHAKRRFKERKHKTGCVKAIFVPATNRTVAATVVPCRAKDADDVQLVRTPQRSARRPPS